MRRFSDKLLISILLLVITFTLSLFVSNNEANSFGRRKSRGAIAASLASSRNTSWKDLSKPVCVVGVDEVYFYQFSLLNGSKANLIVANLNSGKWLLESAMPQNIAQTSRQAVASNSAVAVNGGFFNKASQQSLSFVMKDGIVLSDPKDNPAIANNASLKPYLNQILNRSEVRVLQDEQGKSIVQLVPHDQPVPDGLKLVQVVQAGPALLPAVREREEAFVRKDAKGRQTDAIDCHKPRARTAVGVTPDNYVLIACVAGKEQDRGSSGLNLQQLAQLFKSLGAIQALNLDGGSSTTMYVNLCPKHGTHNSGKVVCGMQPESRIKSVLLLNKVKK